MPDALLLSEAGRLIMAGENKARLVRDRATSMVRRASVRREQDGDPEVAGILSDLADEIAAIPIQGDQ